MSNSDALLAHVVSRMQADIDFLVAQGAISATDGQFMSGRLPSAQQLPTPSPTPTHVAPSVRRGGPPPPPPPPAPPHSQIPRAKALWPYNENGQEVGDLSFNTGETIEILEETNADWWKGKNSRGETGLFPSNYVQKLPRAVPVPAVSSAFPGGRMVAPIPADTASYNPMPVAPPESQAQDVQPPKKKFGNFGGTMAHAAAGGVGFGAGAAVGGGIINAIF